jgi:Na+/H+-translocating membrane pyrophosphatase
MGDDIGMTADLFESYTVMLTLLLVLDKRAFGNDDLIVPMIGTEITVVIGTFVVSPGKEDRSGMTTINRSVFASAMVSGSLVAIARSSS